MAKKRESRARSAKRPQRPPQKPAYPAPAEREKIIERRDELLRQMLPLFLGEPGSKQDQGIARLAAKYGMQELTRVMAAFQRQVRRRDFIGEESHLWRIYRQTFARFGGGRRFLLKQEYEELVVEHGMLLALPAVWSQMGAEAEPPLWAYLDDEDHHSDKRALVAMGLKAIAEAHPKRRPEIVAALIDRLRQAPAAAARMNGYLVFILNKMEAIEARDAIAEAFAQDRIDTRIMQWHDVSMLHGR